MTEPRRLVNLPGYDTGADVFETPDLTDDTSTTILTQQTSPRSAPSETSGTSGEEDDGDEGYGVSRRRLYPERARSRFGAEARRVRTSGADLSDRVDGKRKGYRVRSRVRGDGEEEEEGRLEARIARLRREIEECRVEAERQVDGGVEKDLEGTVEEVDALSRLLAGIGMQGSRVKDTRSPAPRSGAPPGQYPASEEDEIADEQTLGRVAVFDSRLAALEQVLGISALDSATSYAISAPVLLSLTLLDQQLSALTSATSLANLEAASSRIQKLKAETESLARPQTSPPAAAVNGDTEEVEPTPLSQEDITKLQSLCQLLPTLQSLSPTVPALLTRLRSLRTLHTDAANAASELDDVEKRQQEMDKELAAWKNGLEKVDRAVQEASEANGRNGKVVEGWVRELEGRMKALPR